MLLFVRLVLGSSGLLQAPAFSLARRGGDSFLVASSSRSRLLIPGRGSSLLERVVSIQCHADRVGFSRQIVGGTGKAHMPTHRRRGVARVNH